MTDRELMELAAQAADYCLTDGSQGYRTFRCKGGVEWNPLEDDGDAFRLAVKLGLDIMPGDNDQEASTRNYTVQANEPNGRDPYAACRRAIVRAAAKLAEKQAA